MIISHRILFLKSQKNIILKMDVRTFFTIAFRIKPNINHNYKFEIDNSNTPKLTEEQSVSNLQTDRL